MKNIVTTFICAIITFSTTAQSSSQGNFNITLGGNASGGLTLLELYINDVLVDSDDEGGALATMVPFAVNFHPLDFLSVNAGFRMGSWLDEDPDNPNLNIIEKKVSQLMLGLKLYPLNKEKFNLFLGYDFGIGGFSTIKSNVNTPSVEESQVWKGNSHNINLGFNAYFGESFGMYFQTGYAGYKFDLESLSVGANSLDLTNLNYDLSVKGIQLELGIAYKFGL